MTHACFKCQNTKIILTAITCIFSTCFILFSAYAQTDADYKIPDYCIIDGEVDCSRPECHDICFTPPTPGYERTPFIAPESRLTNDTEEFSADRVYANKPTLPMPFTYDPLPPETEKTEVKPEPVPQKKEPVYEECKRVKDNRFLFYEHQIEFYGSIIHKNDRELKPSNDMMKWYKPYSTQTKKYNDDYQFDLEGMVSNIRQYDYFLGRALEKSCFKSGKKCIQGGDEAIRKRINDYYMASNHASRVRESYVEDKMRCLRVCEKSSFYAWEDHDHCNDYFSPCTDKKEEKEFLERVQEKEKKQHEIYEELLKQRCWP